MWGLSVSLTRKGIMVQLETRRLFLLAAAALLPVTVLLAGCQPSSTEDPDAAATAPGAPTRDGDPVTLGTYRVLASEILDEVRVLQVRIPTGYDDTDESYPVVYLFHSDEVDLYFSLAVHDLRVLGRNQMPPVILVGIANTDRLRDMLPWPTPNGRGGQAERFLEFVTTELIPFVESEYRANGTRILVGPQVSAEFVAWAMMMNPERFDAFIIENPCGIEWEPNSLCGPMVDFARSPAAVGKYLSISSPADPPREAIEYLREIETGLTERVADGFRWRVDMREGAGNFHDSHSMRDAFRALFAEASFGG